MSAVKNNNLSEQEINQEINLISMYKKIKRNIFLLVAILSGGTIFSINYAFRQIPVYSGKFQIVVRNDDLNKSGAGGVNGIGGILRITGISGANNTKDTQELILKSPFVLKPVYEYALKEYKSRDQDIENLSYKKWVDEYLNLKFIDASDVFQITFKDINQDFILKTLNLISEKYQIYSKREHKKNISKKINFLIKQRKIYEEKNETSFKKFNDFSIENNMGDNQSFESSNSLPSIDLGSSQGNQVLRSLQTQSQGRFDNQFALLEEYEMRYAKYSTILKENSEYLVSLKSQIERLRESIKKPNEILLKYNELKKNSLRDEQVLNSINVQLTNTEFEAAKQKDPWELISVPTIDDQKVFPNKKLIVINYFVFSLFIALILITLKETIIGNIDNFELIKSKLRAKYYDNIPLSNENSDIKLIELNLRNISSQILKPKAKEKIGICNFNNIELIDNYLLTNPNLSLIELDNFDLDDTLKFIIIFVESGKITNKNIKLLNKYISLYKEKDFYWFYLENE